MSITSVVQEKVNGPQSLSRSPRVPFFHSLHASLNSPYAVWVICAFFVASLFVWNILDHSIPDHDAAWHAIYSSDVRRFLIHPHDWTMPNLLALGKQHFGYPPGAWAFNGALKVIFGDGSWGDRLCLIVQTVLLAVSFSKLAFLTFRDRARSNLGLIVLLSFPLVCILQRHPLIDLLHTACYCAFIASLVAWTRASSWKNAAIAGAMLGALCLSKQIGVFYGGPIVAMLFLWHLWKRQFEKSAQLFVIGSSGLACLLFFWLLPNFAEISAYTHMRAPATISTVAKITMILNNFTLSLKQIIDAEGPAILAASLLLAFSADLKETLKAVFLPAISATLGWLLIITIAYYNGPEARYFGPMLIPTALIIGALTGGALKSVSPLRAATAISIPLFAVIQMCVLCFQPIPLVKTQDNPMVSSLAFEPAGDRWKQRWIFEQIAAVEKQRFVWLNVLPSSHEFDQGSLIYEGQRMKSHAIPITWRTCMADMSDSFKFTPQEFNSVDWFLLKTGNQGSRLYDESSRQNFQKAIDIIEKGGDYQLMASTQLPDGGILKLYRKDYAKIWIRNSKTGR